MENKKAPYSINGCNQTVMKVIEDYRDATRAAIAEMIKIKPHTGVWSPACVQHGFSDSPSFNDPGFKVPSTVGKSMPEVIS